MTIVKTTSSHDQKKMMGDKVEVRHDMNRFAILHTTTNNKLTSRAEESYCFIKTCITSSSNTHSTNHRSSWQEHAQMALPTTRNDICEHGTRHLVFNLTVRDGSLALL